MPFTPYAPPPGYVVQLVPTGDPGGNGDADLIMNAAAQLAGLPVAVVRCSPAREWNLNGGQVVINRTGLTLDMAGCYVNQVGAGAAVRMYDSSNYLGRTVRGGGIHGNPVFDGAGTTGPSSAVHMGDILGLELNVQAQNYLGAGSIGLWLDNNYWYAEQAHGRMFAQNCTTHIQFDNSANTGGNATGSFDGADLRMNVAQAGGGDGIVFNNGALMIDGDLFYRGNFNTAAASYAALRIEGSNAQNASFLNNCRLFVGCELNDSVNIRPVTIAFGASNVLKNCRGFLDFSGDYAFTPSNNAGQFLFSGTVLGDANLYPLDYQQSAGQNVAANGTTLFTHYVGVMVVTNAAAFTGMILQPGFNAGQRVTVLNHGTGGLTFAAAGVSNVADGAADVIAPNTAATFTWDTASALWYRSV